MTVLVVIDALRWDIATDSEIMPNLNEFNTVKPIWANNNTTEPCLTTILSGKHPIEHRVLGLVQPDSNYLINQTINEQSWSMFSPATVFDRSSVIGEFQRGTKFNEIDEDILDNEVAILHVMDVHDYYDRGNWRKFYNGYEELPEEKVREEITEMNGWKVPWYNIDTIDNDAGMLKAIYKAAANNIDSWLSEIKEICEEENRLLIVTADHGECFGEDNPYPQPVFRHVALWDSVLKVPLAINRDIEIGTHTDHTDIRKIIENQRVVGDRDISIAVEHSWQSGIRVTKDDRYFIKYWNKAYEDYPDEFGDKDLKSHVDNVIKEFPKQPPSMLEL